MNDVYSMAYTAGGGRLGNQLLNYANLLAFSREHSEFNIVNLAFSPYVGEYGNKALAKSPLGSINLKRPWSILVEIAEYEPPKRIPYSEFRWPRLELLHRIANYRADSQSIIGGPTHTRFALSGERYDRFDLANQNNVTQLQKYPISVVAGWNVRAWPLVSKYREEIRSLLQPGKRHQAVAKQFVASLRDKFDVLVGALVRQGDYRTWNNGRYFFKWLC